MNKVKTNTPYVGRANTVLVFGSGDDAKAVISTIVVRVRSKEDGTRVHYKGVASFDEKTAKHILEMVLPIADNIFRHLGQPQKYFEISIVNLEASSIMNIGLSVSGFSSDVPILLAILSASLQIAVQEDIVSTGHIASTDGDVRMVKGLPAKLTASINAESIRTFVHPAIDQDCSLDTLSPVEKKRISESLINAKQHLKTIEIRDISELMEIVFSDEHVVSAGLRNGFYMHPKSDFFNETPCCKAVKFLTENNEKRLWKVLERQLLAGFNDDAKVLLKALSQFYIHRKIYPKVFGRSLQRLVYSLPPETRRLKLKFPLLPISECIQLSQFAKESEHEDVRLLMMASYGEKVQQASIGEQKRSSNDTDIELNIGMLQSILTEIDADTLTKRFGKPVDSARATYIMNTVTVKTSEEFNDTISSFYIHLMRYTRDVTELLVPNSFEAEAFALLERTFNKKGGHTAALAEAKNAINGGLRYVLDLMTDQFKREEQEKHVARVLKFALDPLDWEGKVDLIGEVIKRLEPHLPAEVVTQPPERFAVYYDLIVRAYVNSIEQVKSLFRSL